MNSKSFSVIVILSVLLPFLVSASGVAAGALAPVGAGVDTAHPPQGLPAEEWAGILRQVRQAGDHLAAGSLALRQVKKLTASDGAAGDSFGRPVAISGEAVVVGASDADVGGNHAQGAVYVFARSQGGADNWGQVKKLTASGGEARDSFGSSVAISGETVVVGAYYFYAGVGSKNSRGAVYVFARNQGGADNWGQVKKLTASDGAANDWFGDSAVSGETIVVGAHAASVGDNRDQGAAYVFPRNQDSRGLCGGAVALPLVLLGLVWVHPRKNTQPPAG
jgi:hypothetical protein